MPSRLELAFDRRRLLAKRALFRLKMKLSGNARPSSYPYISSDSFRAIADHIYDRDSITAFDPKAVKPGDLVHVNDDLLKEYLAGPHKQIPHPYIIFGFNSDTNVSKEISSLLDENVFRLYAQDVIAEHPRIVPVPMGLESLRYYASGIVSEYKRLQSKIRRHPPLRADRIFFKFNLRTNPPERNEAAAYLSAHPLAETLESKISPTLHARLLAEYKFVASPPGATIESGKTWEALYLRTIPIVKDNASMRSFAALGLPLWVVYDWHELDGLSEDGLARRYDILIKNASWEALYMGYWIKRIRGDQALIRAKFS